MTQVLIKKKNDDVNEHRFSLKPDLKYFYNTRPHKRAMMHLRVGFEQPDGILVLTGEKGMGKTSLIAHMLEQLDKNNNVVALISKPPQKSHEFLPSILAAFKIPVTEHQPKVLFKALQQFLIEQAKLNKKVLLVIDDAETLTHNCLEVIRLLSTLRINEHGLLQTLLVGTNEFEENLATEDNQLFKQQIVMSYCIQPLQVSDTREYIEHRLRVAGWNGSPAIDEDTFDAIHQLTGGVPYVINRYCDRLLMPGILRKNQTAFDNNESNPAAAIIDKLEQLETENLRQKKHTASPGAIGEQSQTDFNEKKIEEMQHAFAGNDFEDFQVKTQTKKPERILNKQTILIILVMFLLSALSVFVYDKMSGNKLAIPFLTTSDNHSDGNSHNEVKSHAVVDAHSVSGGNSGHSEGGLKTEIYILGDMHGDTEAGSTTGAHVSEAPLLNIQDLLQKKSSNSEQEANNTQTNTLITGDAGH